MTEPPDPSTPGEEEPLEPIRRDRVFLYKLVFAIAVGITVTVMIAGRMKRAAAGCGAGLIRPGASVIPPEPSTSSATSARTDRQ